MSFAERIRVGQFDGLFVDRDDDAEFVECGDQCFCTTWQRIAATRGS